MLLELSVAGQQPAAPRDRGERAAAVGAEGQRLEVAEDAFGRGVIALANVRLCELLRPLCDPRFAQPLLLHEPCGGLEPRDGLAVAPEADLEKSEARAREDEDRSDAQPLGDGHGLLDVLPAVLDPTLTGLDRRQLNQAVGELCDLAQLAGERHRLGSRRVGSRPVAETEARLGQAREHERECCHIARGSRALGEPSDRCHRSGVLAGPDQALRDPGR